MYTQDALPSAFPKLDTDLGMFTCFHNVAVSARTAHPAHEFAEDGRLLLGSVGRVTASGFSIAVQLSSDGQFDGMHSIRRTIRC